MLGLSMQILGRPARLSWVQTDGYKDCYSYDGRMPE